MRSGWESLEPTDAEGGGRQSPRRSARPYRDPADVAVALHDRAVALYTSGERDKARAACRRSLRLMERAVGPDHPAVAAIEWRRLLRRVIDPIPF